MSQQQRSSPDQAEGQDKAYEDQQRKRAGAGEGTFGDRAAEARTADDPRVKAPRDRAGMPSTGDEQL